LRIAGRSNCERVGWQYCRDFDLSPGELKAGCTLLAQLASLFGEIAPTHKDDGRTLLVLLTVNLLSWV
jgi:hypothetical protein